MRIHPAALLLFAVALAVPLPAQQQPRTLTILMLDGKTGHPIVPSNFLIRFDHRNATRNDTLAIDDDGIGTVTLPPGATYIAVQGTFNGSMDIYVNCDAAMQKDISTLHWYSVADILSTGVAAPNECYKAKYAEATHTPLTPGKFVFYVRKSNWHESAPE